MYVEGDVPYVGNNCNNGGWNDWSWIIGLAVVGGIFGNGGFGFGGGNRPYGYGAPATQADLANGFAQNTLQRGIDDIILGQAQMQNFVNQGFSGLNTALNTGFAGVNNAVCTLGYQNAQLVNGLSRELAECCCTTNRNLDSIRYENAKNTCDIIRAGQDNTNAIIGWLTQEKISSLQAENAGLKAQISNDMQTRTLINEIKPCPVPAYITCNPYQSAYGFGLNNGCGCN
jgi:hypothetical protein